ncbi:MAG: nucleotidyltransferase family protein, partial [Tepidisphaeraceae bacterium]
WLIALADMPFVSPETLRTVIRHLEAGATITAPSFNGQRGHPVGFGRSLYGELIALEGDVGAREVLARHANKLKILVCTDPGICRDVDTPEDLESDLTSR